MKTPQYNDYFPLAEYEQRIARIREQIISHGLDAVLLTTQPNVDYSSGFLHGTWSPAFGQGTVQVLITATDEPPVLFAPSGLQALFVTSALSDIRATSDADYGTSPSDFYDVFKAKNLLNGKIGIEQSKEDLMGLSYPLFCAMKEKMPNVVFKDCSALMYDVRKTKSPLEVEKIRQAVSITSRSLEVALPQIREGMSEVELANLVAQEMAKHTDEGAARNPWFIFVYADGKSPTAWDGIPSSYRFAKGDCIYVDCGAVYHGYHSDIIRIASIGQASDAKQRIYYGARDANMALIKHMKPGMRISQLCDFLSETMIDLGFASEVQMMRKFGGMYEGHGIGLSIHEAPMIKRDNKDVLQAGMTLAIEGNIFDNLPLSKTTIALKNEENVLITSGGCELLSTLPNDIWVAK
ncbi:MAG: aminopeptidase P family protein [Clostridia bacterium]|jgi:Xaa-Pro aminopeptidase|nr:aminopeptidase P family protein [Clostridia bacterium]MBT7121518.1 aminopeptidase P family protein [Clostridia bacterium]